MKEHAMAFGSGFSMLKKAAATQAAAPSTPVAPATPAPTPAPVPETPAPAPAPAPAAKVTKVVTAKAERIPAPAPAPAPATQAVATVAPANFAVKLATKNKVLAIIAAAEADGGDFVEPIPALVLKGGDSGGITVPAKGVPAEIAGQLPQGKTPLLAQLLSYRILVQAWPTHYDDRQEGDRPTIDCAIPPGDAELALAAMKGAENYNFCIKDQKPKWTTANGGPGILHPLMELLVYWPMADDVILLRTCPQFKTVTTMAQALAGLCDVDGNLIQQPIFFEPVSATWYDKHMFHYWKLTAQLNEAGQACHEKHAAWHEQVGETRPDLVATMMAWFSGEDKPVSDEHRKLIMQAASMTNPRRARS